MECRSCRATLPPGANFCHLCGAELRPSPDRQRDQDKNIPSIDAIHRLAPQKYIDQLMSGSSSVSGERRIVSTLFVDVVDSTGLAEKLDPEDVTTIMNCAFRVLAKPVEQHDGTIARLMGDAMLCLFGAPVAHEDDPVRACRTGLGMVTAVQEFARDLVERYQLESFNVRVGISTGLAVVGEVGTELRAEYTAMGDSVNLASRLQHAARPGTVLICDRTRKQIEHLFEVHDAGAITVRGKSVPVQAFELRLPRTQGAPYAPSDRVDPPMVGRDRELDVITNSISALQAGRGGIAAIIGDPGVGKSRLMQEVRRRAPADVKWSIGRCTPLNRKNGYAVCREILHDILAIDHGVQTKALEEKLRHSINELLAGEGGGADHSDNAGAISESEPIYALLGNMLHLPLKGVEERYLSSLDPRDLPERMANAFCLYMTRRARQDKYAVIWEDAHWMDPESLQTLKKLAGSASEHPILLVLLCRREASPALDLIETIAGDDARGFHRVELKPLHRRDVEKIMQDYLRQTVPQSLADSIATATEGNPFFLKEILRSLTESGQMEPGSVAGQAENPLLAIELPHSIQAAILSRVDRLPYHCKRVLQSASVLGRYFRKEILLKMVADDMDRDRAEDAFSVLMQREFIQRVDEPTRGLSQEDAEGASPGTNANHSVSGSGTEQQYQLVHAMTLEVVYNSLLKTDRKNMHRLAGEAIEAVVGDGIESHTSELAYHFDRAEEATKAIQYHVMAADESLKVFALDRALNYYTRALELADGTSSDSPAIVKIREGIGDVCYFMGDYPNALESLEQALDEEEDTRHKVILYLKKGRLLEKWRRFDLAKESLEAGLEIMAEGFDEREAGRIYAELCLVYYHLRDLDNAIELGNLALIMMQSHGDEMDMAQACNNLGVVYRKKGEPDRAAEYFDQGLELWEKSGNTYGLASCHNNLGLVAKEREEFPTAQDHFHESATLFEKLGNQQGLARAYDNLSQLYFQMGREDESQEYLEKAVRILAEIGGGGIDQDPDIWQSGIW